MIKISSIKKEKIVDKCKKMRTKDYQYQIRWSREYCNIRFRDAVSL